VWEMASSSLAASLTVIITTSAAPSNPSTELIEQVLASLECHARALAECKMLIVCDGTRASAKNLFRSGRVDEPAAARYAQYKQRLRTLAVASRFELRLLELPTNHGFGYAVRAALGEVHTPLVCVIQHDRTFLRAVDVEAVATSVLESKGAVGYVLLPTRSTHSYPQQVASRLGELGCRGDLDITRLARPMSCAGLRLLPCPKWYDSTHISSTQHYQEVIFAEGEGRLLTQGRFIESELGGRQLNDFASLGIAAAVAVWATWLFDDGLPAPIVGHLNGARTVAPLGALDAKFPQSTHGSIGRRWEPPTAAPYEPQSESEAQEVRAPND